MRRVWIFITLKAREVGISIAIPVIVGGGFFGLFAALRGLGYGVIWLLDRNQLPMPGDELQVVGATVVLGIALLLLLCYGCYRFPSWIKSNWQKAGILARRTD